jgi:hypothetical protein
MKLLFTLMQCLLVSFIALKPPPAGAASAQQAADLWRAHGGQIQLQLNTDLMQALGLYVGPEGNPASDIHASRSTLNVSLDPSAVLRFDANARSFNAFADGELPLQAKLQLQRGAKSKVLDDLRLRVNPDQPRTLLLVDAQGAVWFSADTAQIYLSPDRASVRVTHADFAFGPAAAAFFGQATLSGVAIGNFHLQAPVVSANVVRASAAICPSNHWHGTLVNPSQPAGPRYQTDVLLQQVRGLQMQRCRDCDGPVGAFDGTVIMAPDALLANSNTATTADAPWHQKFTGAFPPYNNDQHPILVWNMYRQHRLSGQLEQIGRSGAKHAFASSNYDCPSYDCGNSQILYRQCTDEYPSGTNDYSEFMRPRSEVVASKGIWARCGSLDDPDCDGFTNYPLPDDYQYRLDVLESQLSDSANYRYFYEGWYVVRDDVNIYNSMGSREFTPVFDMGAWLESAPGAFFSGPLIDQWVNPAAPGAGNLSTELILPDGHIKLAVRTTALAAGRWRYDYALMNLDYVHAQLQAENGEPANMRLLSRSAIAGLRLPMGLPPGQSAQSPSFSDGNAQMQDWAISNTPSELQFNAVTSAQELTWGVLNSFSFEAGVAPSLGYATMVLPGAGNVQVATLLPGLSDSIFNSGFE